MLAPSVREPDIVRAPVPATVPVNPVKSTLPQPVLPVAMVTAPVDEALKKQLSALVGRVAPLAPPDVSDHLLPAVPSQLAVSPTQYLSAAWVVEVNSRKEEIVMAKIKKNFFNIIKILTSK